MRKSNCFLTKDIENDERPPESSLGLNYSSQQSIDQQFLATQHHHEYVEQDAH